MRALVLDGSWEPREGAPEVAYKADRRAIDARRAWRYPRLTVAEVPDPPSPGPGEVVVKVAHCGVCGEDLNLARSDSEGYALFPWVLRLPLIPGHEISGHIVAVGEGCDGLTIGEPIAAEALQTCGACVACQAGLPNSCVRVEHLGFSLNGGFAEFVTVPARHCWSLRSLVDRYGEEGALEVGALCELLAVAYEGMFNRARGFRPGGYTLVFGAGPIGLAALGLAAAGGSGATICVEPDRRRREIAFALGASAALDPTDKDIGPAVDELTSGRGADLIVEASGNWSAVFPQIETAVAVGGEVVIVGVDTRPATVNLAALQVRSVNIVGTIGHVSRLNFANVINLMASGKLAAEHAITHRVDLAGGHRMLTEHAPPGAAKTLVHPS